MAFVVSAISAAWVAGAAVVGGAALTAATVATIATGVAAAGSVLSIVGKVTKSKELMKIGKVMSIAGGITAVGAGLISSFSSAASSAAGSGATNVVPSAAEGALEAAAGSATDAMANQAIDAVGQAAQTFPVDGGSIAGLGESGSSLMNAAPDITLSAVPQASAAPVAGQPGMSYAQPGMVDPSPISNIQTASATAVPNTPGMMERIGDWYTKLPETEKSRITSSVMQAGGKAVGALFDGWSAEKRLELEEEVRKENQKRYDTGQKNASFVPVIGFQPRLSGGLITSGPKGG